MIDPDGDIDGDGTTNGDEDIAGTDFNDSSSKFEVGSQTMEADGDVTINWTPVLGRTYKVQARADLATGDWVDVATGQNSGTYTDPNPSETSKFYRILVNIVLT